MDTPCIVLPKFKKSKAASWTVTEKEMLLECVKINSHILLQTFSATVTKKAKEECWKSISKTFIHNIHVIGSIAYVQSCIINILPL